MIINVMTLFPEMFDSFKNTSLIGKAIEKGILKINLYNIRDYTESKAKSVDDYVYGGGNGMLMMAQPIYDCYKDIVRDKKNIKTYYLSPRGRVFNQKTAIEMSKESEIILLCGHYEGVDERAIKLLNATEISIGDFVLTGGEIPCMAIIDSVARFVEGVLSNSESVLDESFNNSLLEYPQYTRPYEYEGLKVPDVLLSGDHKKVDEWRKEKSIEITKKNRPDLYNKYLENN
ncbi:MAG: tRNA (guanosine(37)-N1)-methyltransferase TrmD [Lachnospiraceae bacterium]|nr:tRNA (guanosine(37)-N1)-methyltransferase TrmD [Lachnospiraceae bacterium]